MVHPAALRPGSRLEAPLTCFKVWVLSYAIVYELVFEFGGISIQATHWNPLQLFRFRSYARQRSPSDCKRSQPHHARETLYKQAIREEEQ